SIKSPSRSKSASTWLLATITRSGPAATQASTACFSAGSLASHSNATLCTCAPAVSAHDSVAPRASRLALIGPLLPFFPRLGRPTHQRRGRDQRYPIFPSRVKWFLDFYRRIFLDLRASRRHN